MIHYLARMIGHVCAIRYRQSFERVFKDFPEQRAAAEKALARLKKQTRAENERKRDEWMAALERERAEILDEFRQQIGNLAEDAARRTISELASDDLEERMLHNFATELEHLDKNQQAEIKAHFADSEPAVSVRSAFDIPEKWREQLTEVLKQILDRDAKLSFETSPELICGIEMDVGGYSLGWNVNEHLRQLTLDLSQRNHSH